MRFTSEAISAARSDIEATATELSAAAAPPASSLAGLPIGDRALDRFHTRLAERNEADELVLDGLVEALSVVWMVMREADGELAAFLEGSDVTRG